MKGIRSHVGYGWLVEDFSLGFGLAESCLLGVFLFVLGFRLVLSLFSVSGLSLALS